MYGFHGKCYIGMDVVELVEEDSEIVSEPYGHMKSKRASVRECLWLSI